MGANLTFHDLLRTPVDTGNWTLPLSQQFSRQSMGTEILLVAMSLTDLGLSADAAMGESGKNR